MMKAVKATSKGKIQRTSIFNGCCRSFFRSDVAVLIFLVFAASGTGRAQEGAAPVVVSTVIQREVTTEETFIGTVIPSRRTVVGSAVNGSVLQLLVNDGDEVKKNDPLAKLRTKTLEIELAAARAQLNLREQELAELEHGSVAQEIAQAKARSLDTRAVMEYRKAQYRRMKSLFESGTVSQDELDEAISAWLAAEQNHMGTQAAYDLVVEGPRPERIAQAKALLRSQQEEIRRLQDLLGKYTIRAPFNGYVVKKHTEAGSWLRQGDPVVDVVALDPVEIDISVPETHIVFLEVGRVQPVQVESLPEQVLAEMKKPLQGRVVRIVPQADTRSRTFPVKLRVNNPRHGNGHLLKAGMMAKVLLTVGKPQPSLLVPKNALVLGGRAPIVFLVKTDPRSKQATARPVEVEMGVADGSLIQVTGALQEGDQVVVEGNERLRPGTPVRVVRIQPVEG